jgi:hypothetical protein
MCARPYPDRRVTATFPVPEVPCPRQSARERGPGQRLQGIHLRRHWESVEQSSSTRSSEKVATAPGVGPAVLQVAGAHQVSGGGPASDLRLQQQRGAEVAASRRLTIVGVAQAEHVDGARGAHSRARIRAHGNAVMLTSPAVGVHGDACSRTCRIHGGRRINRSARAGEGRPPRTRR